ncbi:MAG: hypothetical protein AABZ60_11140, partial [Planctomycetota bacterium]
SIEQHEQKKTYHYHTENTFSSVEAYQKTLEAHFVPPDLQLKTSLDIKIEGNRTFYHFKRTYFARDFWKMDQLRKKNVDENISKRVSENGLKDLNVQEQKQFLQGLARFECKKRILLVIDALGQMALEYVFSADLLVESETQLLSAYEKILNVTRIESWLNLIQQLENAKKNKEDSSKQKLLEEQITQQLAQIEEEFAKAEQNTLKEIFQNSPQLPYAKYLQNMKESFHFTEDLSDERFEFRLELPGKLLYTNGLRPSKTQEKLIFWEFDGKDLNNRHIPMEAISVVEKE